MKVWIWKTSYPKEWCSNTLSWAGGGDVLGCGRRLRHSKKQNKSEHLSWDRVLLFRVSFFCLLGFFLPLSDYSHASLGCPDASLRCPELWPFYFVRSVPPPSLGTFFEKKCYLTSIQFMTSRFQRSSQKAANITLAWFVKVVSTACAAPLFCKKFTDSS